MLFHPAHLIVADSLQDINALEKDSIGLLTRLQQQHNTGGEHIPGVTLALLHLGQAYRSRQ